MASALTVYVSQAAAPPCVRVFEFLRRRGYAYTTAEVISDEDRADLPARTGYGRARSSSPARKSSASSQTRSRPTDPDA